MTPYEIVSCSKAHTEVVAALHGACFDKAWDGAAITGFMSTPGTFGFIGCCGPIPQGFILCRAAGGECEIVCLGVSTGHRRASLATRLLTMALESAAGKGAEWVFLEVAEDNEPARRFYQVQGFKEVGRHPGYYRRTSGGPVDAMVLRARPESYCLQINKR
jgi:ribosomal-protein-alanine N-acetyltransferase